MIMTSRKNLLSAVLRAAPWCAFAALAITLYQRYGVEIRPKGGAGNPGIFAVTVAILFAYTLAGFFDEKREWWWRGIALAGVAAAVAVLISSGTRALWPSLVIFPVLLWFATAKTGAPSRRTVMLALAVIIIVSVALAGRFRNAYHEAVGDIAASETGQYETSLGKRYVIWQVALNAIPEHPILGFGPDSPRRLMEERTVKLTGTSVIYSHFHDVILNEMVRAGIVGTLALLSMIVVPFYFCLRAPRDKIAAFGFGLLMCIQCAFLLSGTVSLMIDHDILDTQFLANTVMGLFFVFGRDNEEQA